MDGNAKAYRTVCSFSSEKVEEKGLLNQFVECANSPLPDKTRCRNHLTENENHPPERLDLGVLTRARRRQLGLDSDTLTEEEGCRKRDMINQRTNRSKTAGICIIIPTRFS